MTKKKHFYRQNFGKQTFCTKFNLIIQLLQISNKKTNASKKPKNFQPVDYNFS